MTVAKNFWLPGFLSNHLPSILYVVVPGDLHSSTNGHEKLCFCANITVISLLEIYGLGFPGFVSKFFPKYYLCFPS